MEKQKTLSASLQNYLKAVYSLHKTDSSVRLVDIAERLSVSKPSVFNAVTQLSEMGLAEHVRFGPVLLTAKGIDMAQGLAGRHETIKLFLMRVLGIGESEARSEACAIEHIICDVTLAKMAAMV